MTQPPLPLNPAEEAISQAPDYRFPVVQQATAAFTVKLPAFPAAPEGFSGTLDQLLERLRQGRLKLEHVPLAPIVDQYLGFRQGLQPEEAQERLSDFLPLAATLICLKSQLFVQQVKAKPEQVEAAREQIVEEIRREERRRREEQAAPEKLDSAEQGPQRLTLLDLMVLLQDVQNSLQASLTVSEEDLSVRDAMRWIRESLPEDAALAAATYFEQCRTRRDQAAVFLAVLELSRHRFLDCQQAEAFTPLWLGRTQEAAVPAAADHQS